MDLTDAVFPCNKMEIFFFGLEIRRLREKMIELNRHLKTIFTLLISIPL